MTYECDHCEAVLGPGMTACPRCGQAFDEPVPADATFTEEPVAAPALPATAPPAKTKRRSRLPKMTLWLAASLLLVSLGWLLGVRHAALTVPTLSSPVTAPAPTALPNGLPSDLAAHPSYPRDMSAFLRNLRATGLGAQWPCFGNNDTLLITPQAVVNGQRAIYDQHLYRELAQGIYANFAFRRYDSGFSDTDSYTCFVIVSDSSGRVVAADLMGTLE